MKRSYPNKAFVDGQNLYLGTKEDGWTANYAALRTYLKDKYLVGEAYYFLGYVSEEQQDVYNAIQKAGFILVFREHSSQLMGKKKGNVDCDIVFSVMREIAEQTLFGKAYIISGDGDSKKLVDYLIRKNLFGKILFPNKKFASSLYTKLGREYFDYLNAPGVRSKIEHIKKHK